MLNIKTFPVNPLDVNCYVVSDETKEAVIIDPGCFAESEWNNIYTYINNEKLNVVHLLLTHMHFDHIMGCHLVNRDLALTPEGHADDVSLYKNLQQQTTRFLGAGIKTPEQPPMGKCLNEGATVTFGTHDIKVLHTPGHSQGGVCYHIESEDVVFTGDTLFAGSMGRTDLEGGSYSVIMNSLQRLALLPSSTKVYPGHGPSTTIDYEKAWILRTSNR